MILLLEILKIKIVVLTKIKSINIIYIPTYLPIYAVEYFNLRLSK